jgi:hypothetical protein
MTPWRRLRTNTISPARLPPSPTPKTSPKYGCLRRYEQWLLRTFRNHFEHFDERLERWAASPEPRTPTDSNIGPVSAISGLELDDRLRHFDPTTYTVTFRGETYHLRPIIEAIQAIHLRAVEKCRERASGIPDRTQGTLCRDKTIGTLGTTTI